MNEHISRRTALEKITGGAVAMAGAAGLAQRVQAADAAKESKLKNRINHSVCKWCYNDIPLDDFCHFQGRAMGLQSVELLEVKDFPTLKAHDLVCAMVSSITGGISSGLNRVENHDRSWPL